VEGKRGVERIDGGFDEGEEGLIGGREGFGRNKKEIFWRFFGQFS
jgi:hypothetical protein